MILQPYQEAEKMVYEHTIKASYRHKIFEYPEKKYTEIFMS
jgi:hypothetical protein